LVTVDGDAVSLHFSTLDFEVPNTESYFQEMGQRGGHPSGSFTRDEVDVLVGPSAARMILRPIRPNPLIPHLHSHHSSDRKRLREKKGILMYDQPVTKPCRPCTVLYSLLIVVFGVIASPYLAYQALRYKK